MPRQNEVIWGWLPASLLLMLRNFNLLGELGEQLPVLGEVDAVYSLLTGVSDLSLFAAQFALAFTGLAMYLYASMYMVACTTMPSRPEA